MKYSFDTYDLYKLSAIVRYTIRIRVHMKQEVELDVLRRAVNTATLRYPYFMVKLSVDDSGAYVLLPNDAPITVIQTSTRNPELCSEEVGGHLLYVDTEGSDIYFNISHSLAGGRGAFPWVMTCVYEYITEKFHVTLNAPAIRRPGSPLLQGENEEPREELFAQAEAPSVERCRGGKILMSDYLCSLLNPLRRSNEYFIFSFEQRELIRMAKANDNSLASLFSVLMFKTMDAVLPPKDQLIVGEIPHNPAASVGMPNTRYNLLSHLKIPYKRSMADWPLEKLGTVTRGSMALQTDPQYSLYEVKQAFAYDNALDDKVFCCYNQVLRTDKYINAFRKVLDDIGITYTMEGPYPKSLAKHQIK